MEGENTLEVWGVGTTRTLRVHWMLHELGIDYETHRIQSRTGETQTAEYLALNPKGKIPTLPTSVRVRLRVTRDLARPRVVSHPARS